MTSPDSREPQPELPEHERQAWDAIVADLSGQIDLGPQFPKDPVGPPSVHPELDVTDLEPADERYVPPTPPPIPRPSDAIGKSSWLAVLGGPVLVLATNVLGWDSWLSGLGVALTIGGFIALVARMKDRDDDDNGAVV